MRGLSRTIPATIIIITTLLLSAGCTPQTPEERHISATRTKIYSSQDELIKDSALIEVYSGAFCVAGRGLSDG